MNRTILKVVLIAFTLLLLSPIDFFPGMPVDDILYAVGDIFILMLLQRVGWRDPGVRPKPKAGEPPIIIRPESASSTPETKTAEKE